MASCIPVENAVTPCVSTDVGPLTPPVDVRLVQRKSSSTWEDLGASLALLLRQAQHHIRRLCRKQTITSGFEHSISAVHSLRNLLQCLSLLLLLSQFQPPVSLCTMHTSPLLVWPVSLHQLLSLSLLPVYLRQSMLSIFLVLWPLSQAAWTKSGARTSWTGISGSGTCPSGHSFNPMGGKGYSSWWHHLRVSSLMDKISGPQDTPLHQDKSVRTSHRPRYGEVISRKLLGCVVFGE